MSWNKTFSFLFIGYLLNIYLYLKLDGVDSVDNRTSTYKLPHYVQKIKWCHVTHDMWNVTCDMWHVTCDTWHLTCWGLWTFSQSFSSLALTVSDLWYYEDMEEKAHLLTDWMNYEAVYRTASSTPGLFISWSNIYEFATWIGDFFSSSFSCL